MENVDNGTKDNKILKGIKRFGNGVIGMSEMAAGTVLTMGSMVVPATAIIGVPMVLDGSLRVKDTIVNTEKTGSLITSIPNWKGNNVNHISQDLNSVMDLLKPIGIRDKKTFLLTQELNFLLNSSKKDKDGNPVTFNTKSQNITRNVLQDAEKAGLIENFTYEKIGKKRFVTEKIMMGNFKNLFRKNFEYEMNFNITDKKVSDEQVMQFLELDSLDESKFNIKRDEAGNITNIDFKQSYAWKDTFEKIKNRVLFNKNKALESAQEKVKSEEVPEIPKEINNEEKNEKNPISMYKDEVCSLETIAEKDVERELNSKTIIETESQQVEKNEENKDIIE